MMINNNWINPMHTQVPGPDGKISYGGMCFPKDTNALLEFMKKIESDHKIIEACINERNSMRNDKCMYRPRNMPVWTILVFKLHIIIIVKIMMDVLLCFTKCDAV